MQTVTVPLAGFIRLEQQRDAAVEDRDRLKAALQGFLAAYSAEFGDPSRYSGPVSDAARIARELLAQESS